MDKKLAVDFLTEKMNSVSTEEHGLLEMVLYAVNSDAMLNERQQEFVTEALGALCRNEITFLALATYINTCRS